MSTRRSARARRAPPKRDVSVEDDVALQQALRKSLVEKARVVFEVPGAPVFHPTAAEFADPLEYIASIRSEVVLAGIAKIIPPPGWENSHLNLDVKRPFKTKRQKIHTLQEGLPFGEGQVYDQKGYKEYAEAFSRSWLQQHPELAAAVMDASPEDAAQLLEEHYWKVVENVAGEKVSVDYANDIDTEKYGSGFGAWAGQWDMRKLVSAQQSALQQLGFSVEGLTHPWLYFGALFATFCWHTEDHFLYSLNYLHKGASKTWYGVPGSMFRRFEDTMRTAAPERFLEDRDLLHHLITLLPPSLLMSQGVKVVHTVQAEGELVVTFPKAFHCGFSHGWNASEAVNFSTLDWLPLGAEATVRYARGPGKRPAVFSHDKLVWELCDDALEAARLQNGGKERPLLPSRAAHVLQAASTSDSVNAAAVANLGLPMSMSSGLMHASRPVSLPKQKQQPLPSPIGRRSAHFTPLQLLQLADALEAIYKAEIKGRNELRFEGVEDRSMAGVGGGGDGELASCHECGALPFLSTVVCSCNMREMRCMAHAHVGCTCPWPDKHLLLRMGDGQLSSVRRTMRDLASQGKDVRASLVGRTFFGIASETAAREKWRRPIVKPAVADAGRKLKPTIVAEPDSMSQAALLQRAHAAMQSEQQAQLHSCSSPSLDSGSLRSAAQPAAVGMKRPAPVGGHSLRLSGVDKRARMRAAAAAARAAQQQLQQADAGAAAQGPAAQGHHLSGTAVKTASAPEEPAAVEAEAAARWLPYDDLGAASTAVTVQSDHAELAALQACQ